MFFSGKDLKTNGNWEAGIICHGCLFADSVGILLPCEKQSSKVQHYMLRNSARRKKLSLRCQLMQGVANVHHPLLHIVSLMLTSPKLALELVGLSSS